MHLPKLATIEQACAWLEDETGGGWSLARLIESGLVPYFWLDSTPETAALFDGKPEGALMRAVFMPDLNRLEAPVDCALVQIYATEAGQLVKAEPPLPVALRELCFKREDLAELAAAIRRPAKPQRGEADDSELRATIQKLAREYIASELGADRHPGQQFIAEHVARQLRERGIMGKTGVPMSPSYIKRHYLTGITANAQR